LCGVLSHKKNVWDKHEKCLESPEMARKLIRKFFNFLPLFPDTGARALIGASGNFTNYITKDDEFS
jgi:hypothetical protein